MKKILIIFVICCLTCFALYHIGNKVTRFDYPEGDLRWSYVKPENAKMCLPAAFTEKDGMILGSYRYKGKSYQKDRLRFKVSLKGDKFHISTNKLIGYIE